MKNMRQTIIDACVKGLKESYHGCNAGNVLSDCMYSAFAKTSLEMTIEDAGVNSLIGQECRNLINEIESNREAAERQKGKL